MSEHCRPILYDRREPMLVTAVRPKEKIFGIPFENHSHWLVNMSEDLGVSTFPNIPKGADEDGGSNFAKRGGLQILGRRMQLATSS